MPDRALFSLSYSPKCLEGGFRNFACFIVLGSLVCRIVHNSVLFRPHSYVLMRRLNGPAYIKDR